LFLGNIFGKKFQFKKNVSKISLYYFVKVCAKSMSFKKFFQVYLGTGTKIGIKIMLDSDENYELFYICFFFYLKKLS